MVTQFANKCIGRIAFGVLIAGLAGAPEALAQAGGGCFAAPARLSDGAVAAFVASPQSLLEQFSSGGLPLSNQIRALAGSSSDALAPIVNLAANANAQQSAAIGSGLARAARACATVNPEYAALIQDAVARSRNTALETAFLAATNETQTAALGGVAGGGSPTTLGGGSPGIGGGGSPGGGANGSAGGTSSTGAGTSSFGAGGGGSYFANDDDNDTVSVSPSSR